MPALTEIELNTRDWHVIDNLNPQRFGTGHLPAYRLLVEEIAPDLFVEIGITHHNYVYIIPFADKGDTIQWGNAFGLHLESLHERSFPSWPTLSLALQEGAWMETIPNIPNETNHPLWSYAQEIYDKLQSAPKMKSVNAKIADIALLSGYEYRNTEPPEMPRLRNYRQIGRIQAVSSDDLWEVTDIGIGYSEHDIPFQCSQFSRITEQTQAYSLAVYPFFLLHPKWNRWGRGDILRVYVNGVEPNHVFGDKISYLFSLPNHPRLSHTTSIFHLYSMRADEWNSGFYVWGIGTEEDNGAVAGIVSNFITAPSEMFHKLRKGVPPHILLTEKDIQQIVFSFAEKAVGTW